MKNTLPILFAVVIGSLIGYFGVLVSVFAEGGFSEKLITISVLLFIYIIFSGLWGFYMPKFSWIWGIFLGGPGAIFLILYSISEHNLYFLIYAISVIAFSCLSAKGGSNAKLY